MTKISTFETVQLTAVQRMRKSAVILFHIVIVTQY